MWQRKHAGNENGRDAFVFLHTRACMHDDISVAHTAGVKKLDQVEWAMSWWFVMSQAFLGGSEAKYLKKANSKAFLNGLYTSDFQILYLGLCLHPQLIKSSAEGLEYR